MLVRARFLGAIVDVLLIGGSLRIFFVCATLLEMTERRKMAFVVLWLSINVVDSPNKQIWNDSKVWLIVQFDAPCANLVLL